MEGSRLWEIVLLVDRSPSRAHEVYPSCSLEAGSWAFGNQPADEYRLAVDQSDKATISH